MDKGTVDFASFRRDLEYLCNKYHVLLKKEIVRRENLHGEMKFYEAELSLKLNGPIGGDWIIE